MSDSRCAACGHERAFHRRSNMVDPAPCEASVNEAGGVVACGCKAAFEVDAQRGAMAVFSGLVAGLLAGGPTHRLILEHDPSEPGPPWRLVLERGTPDAATWANGFTLDEALNALADLEEPVKQQMQEDKGLLTKESSERFIANTIRMEHQLLAAAFRRLQQWIDVDPENRALNRLYRRTVPGEGGEEPTQWWVVRVIIFAKAGEPHTHEEAASQRLTDAIEHALAKIGAERLKE